jgi:hypothetical protein
MDPWCGVLPTLTRLTALRLTVKDQGLLDLLQDLQVGPGGLDGGVHGARAVLAHEAASTTWFGGPRKCWHMRRHPPPGSGARVTVQGGCTGLTWWQQQTVPPFRRCGPASPQVMTQLQELALRNCSRTRMWLAVGAPRSQQGAQLPACH